jgi:hypothetical protein
MRTIAARMLASVLASLLAVSCGTVRESRQPGIEERVFLPRAPRVVASPVLEELELRKAIEALLPYVNVEAAQAELRRLVADPRFHGRRPEELRVVLASWGSGPAALEEISRGYRAWCAAVRRTNCHEGPPTDSSIYEIAFDFAIGSQWDGFVGEVKSTIDPSTIRIVLLTGLVIFMATIAIPELVSKIFAWISIWSPRPRSDAVTTASEPSGFHWCASLRFWTFGPFSTRLNRLENFRSPETTAEAFWGTDVATFLSAA